jgi:hypothetical protein
MASAVDGLVAVGQQVLGNLDLKSKTSISEAMESRLRYFVCQLHFRVSTTHQIFAASWLGTTANLLKKGGRIYITKRQFLQVRQVFVPPFSEYQDMSSVTIVEWVSSFY